MERLFVKAIKNTKTIKKDNIYEIYWMNEYSIVVMNMTHLTFSRESFETIDGSLLPPNHHSKEYKQTIIITEELKEDDVLQAMNTEFMFVKNIYYKIEKIVS